jgi:hypothetical protein
MAKKATGKSENTGGRSSKKGSSRSGTQVARVSSGSRRGGSSKGNGFDASDAFIKLLQSPLVAELVAVAATSALAALAQHGFTAGSGGTRGKRAGKAVKEAGKAAAAAVGKRLGTEIDEIRKAAKASA